MKRFAGMMGALLLMPTLALASGDMVSISELRQQGEAMERWTQTYDTPNGKVSVDISSRRMSKMKDGCGFRLAAMSQDLIGRRMLNAKRPPDIRLTWILKKYMQG